MGDSIINKFAVIGSGAMGTAFVKGVIAANLVDARNIVISDIDAEKLMNAKKETGVETDVSNKKAVLSADVVLLAVKPGIIAPVLKEISGVLSSDTLIISIAAGVKIASLESLVDSNVGVIRAMPNTPCQIGAGAVGYSKGTYVSEEQLKKAEKIFNAVGISYEVPENLLNAVTGLSGSGPAYIFLLIDAMSDAGVAVGLPRNISLKLAAQTVMGSAKYLLESGKHPGELRDQVTSPGGTTIAGVEALEKNCFRSALIEAVKAASKRSEELG